MKLAKQYTPNDFEPNIYAMWETSGVFTPQGKGEPYSLVMPPPNANANLHMGHALDMGLKDILARYHRMKGDDVAFIPGADHAGFETWVVYERKLQAEGKSRFDFSREQLYSQVWRFVDENRGNMELQLRALGVSADWQDGVFTLDKKVIKVVYDTFKKMWDEGLVYRGERIVNYCTKHQTSFADIEIEHKTEKGKLWKIAYPLLDSVGELVVATTRPETMLGDTAVAVHPDDERYKKYVGQRVMLPITKREVEIIADEYVDRNFGTGVVKITPAHDQNDYDMAQRHNLEILNIIDEHGKMINVPPQFVGVDVKEARKRVLANLEAEEYLRGESTIEHAVSVCYKCGTVIEPMMKDQWFVSVQPLAQQAIDHLERNEITFYPATKQKEIIAYLGQLRDWNISRQIPWGIPIPAFHNKADYNDWIFYTEVDKPEIMVDGKTYVREEDTFDTWFSSGQWPYVVTDALDAGKLSRFFPTSVMETGSDLLRQWVSRMIMLSLYRTGEVPFKDVYFHGMVNDEKNQKMSKSKGNVINPMELVSEYGSDALRMGIIAGRSAAQAQAFNRGAVIAGRNFCNKIWNIARLVENMVGDHEPVATPTPQTPADHWIVRQLNQAQKTVAEQLEQYRFAEASDTVYHTIWDDVADWYIEVAKVEKNQPMLVWVLDSILKLAHPFVPFVTETIWQTLFWHEPIDDMVITAAWPKNEAFDDIAAERFEQICKLVQEARFVSAELPGNEKYTLLYHKDSLIENNQALILHFVNEVNSIEHVENIRGLRLANSGREAWLDIDAKTLYQHQENLEARLAEVREQIARLEARLANENYISKAPAKLVEETQYELTERQQREQHLMEQISSL